MFRDDENDVPVSSSHEKYFSQSDKGKKFERERKAAEKGKLMSRVEREKLKKEIAPKNVVADDADAIKKEDPTKSKTFGTRTREQELKESIETARKKYDPDALIDEGKRQQAAMDQAQIEEQADQNG